MASKSLPKDADAAPPKEHFNAFEQLQDAGLGDMMHMSTAWMEAVSDMGAEVASFVAERIQEDVKTQHEILQCKNVAELQNIQAHFIHNALEQYQEETGKLLKMGMETFAEATKGRQD